MPTKTESTKTLSVVEVESRIRRAIANLSLKSGTATRVVLDSLLRFVTPRAASLGTDAFQFPYRPHPRNRDRCASGGHRDSLIAFYAGNTVEAYYDLIKAVQKTGSPDSRAYAKLKFLELLVETDLTSFCVTGTAKDGFVLELITDVKERHRREDEDQLAEWNPDPKTNGKPKS